MMGYSCDLHLGHPCRGNGFPKHCLFLMYASFTRGCTALAPLAAAVLISSSGRLSLAEERDSIGGTTLKESRRRRPEHAQVVWMFGDKSSIPYGAGSDLTR